VGLTSAYFLYKSCCQLLLVIHMLFKKLLRHMLSNNLPVFKATSKDKNRIVVDKFR